MIVTDLDKTLLNSEHEITEENLKSIQKIKSENIELVFASGRSYENIKSLLNKYQLKLPVVCLNGAQIYNEHGTLLNKLPLQVEYIKDIILLCEKENLIYQIFTENNTYSKMVDNVIEELYKLALKKTRNMEIVLKGMQIYYNLFYKYSEITPEILSKIFDNNLEIYKIEITSYKTNLLDKIKAMNSEKFHCSYSSDVNVEITMKNINKGYAIDWLAERYNLETEQICAIGDNHNDLEMVSLAGIGIAMENAIEEIKSISNYVTKNNDNSGFAYAINQYILKLV